MSPCLAGNALLLQRKITIHEDVAYMDFRQLIHLVGDYLVNSNPPHPNPEMQANQQQQIADALAVLPKLGRGLDVNIRFQKVTDFEFTDELSVLDMLGMNLVHGWLCDPQDTRTASVIKDMSYNQLICMLVDADDASPPIAAPALNPEPEAGPVDAQWAALPSVVTWNACKSRAVVAAPDGQEAKEGREASASGGQEEEAKGAEEAKAKDKARAERLAKAHIVEEFLQDTASQLTYFGLEQLHSGRWWVAQVRM